MPGPTLPAGPQRIYRNSEVAELTGYHPDYIRQLVRKGRFPRPIPLGGEGGRAVGWLEQRANRHLRGAR